MTRPDYPVGRCRPPQHRQFTKGKSGNPAGRPKGSRSVQSVIEKELLSPVPVHERGGRVTTMPKIQAVIRRLIGTAVQGDHKAAVALLNVAERLASPSPPPAGVSSPPETLEPADAAILAAYRARVREGGGEDDGGLA